MQQPQFAVIEPIDDFLDDESRNEIDCMLRSMSGARFQRGLSPDTLARVAKLLPLPRSAGSTARSPSLLFNSLVVDGTSVFSIGDVVFVQANLELNELASNMVCAFVDFVSRECL